MANTATSLHRTKQAGKQVIEMRIVVVFQEDSRSSSNCRFSREERHPMMTNLTVAYRYLSLLLERMATIDNAKCLVGGTNHVGSAKS